MLGIAPLSCLLCHFNFLSPCLPLTHRPSLSQASTVLGLFSLLFPPCCPLTLLPLSQSVSFPVSPPRFPVSLHLPARQDQPPRPFSPCQEAAEPGVKADLCEVPRGHAVLRGGSGQRHSMEAAPHRQPRGPAHPLQARGQGSGARLAGAGSRHRSMNTPPPQGPLGARSVLTRKVSGPGNTLGAAASQHRTLPSRVVGMGWGGVG